MTEDYEILPHKLLSDLKYDVEALKKKLTQPDTKSNELILEIESLKDSIHELTSVFNKALDETKDQDLGRIVKHVEDELQKVVNQNETIARGMIAISDKVEDWMNRQAPSSPQMARPPVPVIHSMGMPPLQGRVAPPPNINLPPPPPGKKRSGLFK